MLLKYCFLVVILFSSLPVISDELYPSMIETPSLKSYDEKVVIDLLKNKEFLRFIRQDYKTEDISLNFDLVKKDLSKVFYQCNISMFNENPELEKPVNYFIQENLYGYPRVMENGHTYRLVKAAREYPAMNRDIDPFFIDMTSPSKEEYDIYMRDFASMPKLQSKVIERRNKFFSYIISKYKKIFINNFENTLTKSELSEYIFISQSMLVCKLINF